MAGKHRAQKRQAEAHVWLGAGAVTLGLGVALAAGSGVAQADSTNVSVAGSGDTPAPGSSSAATTSIRTTISAQSVNTSTRSSTPVVAGEENPTSKVTTTESVVRQMDPADTGDNDAADSGLASDLLGLGDSDSGILGIGGGPSIPFIELGGGGGGLLSRLAGALGF
ncbi:hypothetical protein [Mycolicibacterium stellerae]|uniref:hypothetical protein n=1 Tax=Mycolicibacterium stellerae TaxID=2358193 RepID=UPI000F0B09D5|nr:hypothetical protein [Mycolicibacterium stellerae]